MADGEDARESNRQPLPIYVCPMQMRDFLSLTRAPAVFSALGNAYAGYWLGGGQEFSWRLLLCMLASGCFLLGGMALNDVADAKVDAVERPGRPIPSGRVGIRTAWAWGLGLLALGLALDAMAGLNTFAVAVVLCGTILAYNFWLKGGFWGPAAMGLCRALNLATGMAITIPAIWREGHGLIFPGGLQPAQIWGLFSLWAYIFLVTFLARDEVQGNSQRRMRLFFAGLSIWALAWAMTALATAPAHALGFLLLLAGGLALAFQLFHPLRRLWHEPSAAHTGRSVGALLRSLPLVDLLALAAAGVAWPWTLGQAFFLLPGAWMMRKIKVT